MLRDSGGYIKIQEDILINNNNNMLSNELRERERENTSEFRGHCVTLLQTPPAQRLSDQNTAKLRHDEIYETFVKSSLSEEPTLKLRMNTDIFSYSKLDPPLKSSVQTEW